MMKKIGFILLTVLCLSCESNNQATQEEEQQRLVELFHQIETLSNSATCENVADWNFVAYGHKACGGPQG